MVVSIVTSGADSLSQVQAREPGRTCVSYQPASIPVLNTPPLLTLYMPSDDGKMSRSRLCVVVGAAVCEWVAADGGVDVLFVLVLLLWPIAATHAVQPPTNPNMTAPMISNTFNGDVDRRAMGGPIGGGGGGGTFTSVHLLPSQYRWPGPPLGSGYQPGGGCGGAAVMATSPLHNHIAQSQMNWA